MTRNSLAATACAGLVGVVLAGCQRPYEQVSTTAPENLSRNVSAPVEARAAKEPQAAPPRAAIPSAEALSDGVITAKIRASLLADDAMRGADVSVNTEHGVVILAGNVKSYEQVGIASAYAQRQDGVMRVDNQLTLAPQ